MPTTTSVEVSGEKASSSSSVTSAASTGAGALAADNTSGAKEERFVGLKGMVGALVGTGMGLLMM